LSEQGLPCACKHSDRVPLFPALPFSIHSELFLIPPDCTLQVCEVSSYLFKPWQQPQSILQVALAPVFDGSLIMAATRSAQVIINTTCPHYPLHTLATPPAHPPSVALAPVFDGSLIMAATRSAQVIINTTCPHYPLQALATPPTHPPTVALAPVSDGSLIMAATRSAQVIINTTCPHYPLQALATPPAHPPSVALAPVFDSSLIMAATRSAQVAINTTCPHYPLQALATPPAHPPSVALAPVFDGSLIMAATRSAQVIINWPGSMNMLKGLKDCWGKIGTPAVGSNMTATSNVALMMNAGSDNTLCVIGQPIAQQLPAIIADTVGRVVAVRLVGVQDYTINVLYRHVLCWSTSVGNLSLQCCLHADSLQTSLPCLGRNRLLKGSVIPGLLHVNGEGLSPCNIGIGIGEPCERVWACVNPQMWGWLMQLHAPSVSRRHV